MQPVDARRLWHVLEHVHAVTYFAPECRDATRSIGLRGFWMGYFAARAAPLGPVAPGVVEAIFATFAPAMVRRALPDAWDFADPEAVVEARHGAAARALRRLAPDVEAVADDVVPVLESCVARAPTTGRPLFGANRELTLPADPVGALWQLATSLREHRGDGHVAALVAADLSGCAPHLLLAAERCLTDELVHEARGWTPEEVARVRADLRRRGLLDGASVLTAAGAELRRTVEETTDALAARAFEPVDDVDALVGRLAVVARAVSASGTVPYPNPMGLPALA